MANTKNSTVREIIIDRLLHQRRGFTVNEIFEKVNNQLELEGLNTVCINTIRNDIDNFRSMYKQKLHIVRKGNYRFIRYEDPNFTIFHNVFTYSELRMLHSAILSICYLDEVQGQLVFTQLTDQLGAQLELNSTDEPILLYENTPSAVELSIFQQLYEFIRTHTPAVITYIPGTIEPERDIEVHPYFLRQKDSKWLLLCRNATDNCPEEIPISIITRVTTASDLKFVPNKDFPITDYYPKFSAE